jgi:hypothetical protein
MEHQAFPAALRNEIYRYLDLHNADERKAGETDAQFYYKTRKKAMGAFKPELWAMEQTAHDAIFMAMEEQFTFFYDRLNAKNTRTLVDSIVTPVEHHKPIPKQARSAGDDLGLAD